MRGLRPLLLLCVLLLGGCGGYRVYKARGQLRVVEDVPYVQGSAHPKQRLDLYLPRAAGPFPVVLFVHGGFWRNQDRRYYQAFTGLHGNVGVALARRGIGVAVQSYRLSPEVGIQEQIADVIAALRFVQGRIAEHGGDPRRVALAGYSAGGHLVALLALDPRHLRDAGVDPQGVRGYAALSAILDVGYMASLQDAGFNRDVTFRLFGEGAPGHARYSPASYLRASAPPLLLLAAERDLPFVLQANRSAAARLQALGAKVRYQEIAGYDHADMVLNINSPDDRVSEPLARFVSGL